MSNQQNDLQDSRRDKEYLKKETTIIDLPEVKDIPGQEHVHPPHLKEMADTTISSSDEEETEVFNEADTETDNDVSEIEKELLQRSSESMSGEDDEAWRTIKPDNTDMDGEQLNVENDFSGDDLDVPGAELDDEDEKIGREDEENNAYSRGQ